MAAKLLLPGLGGIYTTTFTGISTNSTGSDTIDCSKCFTLAVSMTSTSTGAASSNIVQLQQSFDGGTSWINLNTAITAGPVATFPSTNQPFGLVRMLGTVGNGTLTVSLTGLPIQRSW